MHIVIFVDIAHYLSILLKICRSMSFQTCQLCQKDFRDTNSLKRHMAMHGKADTGYKCDKCDKNYATKQTLADHVKKCTGELRCAAMTKDSAGRQVVCGKVLKTPQGFQKHVAAHERKAARERPDYVQPKAPERKYKCNFAGCGKLYISESGLKDHQLGCESNPDWEGPFHCPHPTCKYAERNNFKGWNKRKQLNAHLASIHDEGKNRD